MANLFAAEPDSRGWHEVEQTLTALELPPVPPTSEPQRLLGYVLQILPRYTEMEMLVTHLRLHASTLEQDMEQVKSHVRLLTREATGEREKKQFLERYAAQVVKERNGLLHIERVLETEDHSGGLALCEKLQESLQKVEALQEEVYKQELLRRELDFLLKKTQREHDSRVAADRKHIQQLEKQIAQRSNLHSGLEKKLYETESVLARLDRAKENELNAVNNRVDEAHARVEGLEKENKSLHVLVKRLSDERDRVTQLLEETTESKNVFARRMDELLETCRALESEVEALRSEIDVLQTKDINDIRSQYDARINRLQKDSAAGEEALHQEIDRLRQKLTKRDGSLVLASRAQQGGDMAGVSSERHPKTQRSNVESISLPGDDFKLSDGIFDGDRRHEFECDEEEKRPDTERRLVGDMQGQRSSNISDTRIDQEQSGDYQESVTEEVQTQSDLVRDLYQMLNRLKEKRKREEQKALQVEQALFEFNQLHLKS
ncbi:unnamed protein product [Hyaloperonospora brassicae]|uniref:Uncharacterized protein n=1 Tax=Hyaloperonospora brassicae TaxID=162125 RepID=A0AAV0UT36_HYABA|nr:unnamed protein product [Hyaloperonospora brassicae]